ncbi:MAG: selenocysteine-specific translation elongation factor [Myxococcota bacterium]|nr:selenocysteine-specific translation elongation factor [Myxococcota bacterium]
MIIGTAGHIDHGKTSLVKALTGIDTDRLKEEKSRGITIELGFAHLTLPDGTLAGVVDVPGHERFVKAMAAGAGGVDVAILVVAADEGVMPQTREHLDICRLLGVRAGVIAVTKSDLLGDLGPEWLELLTADLRALCLGTFLQDVLIVPCSARSGEGLEALKAAVAEAGKALPARPAEGPAFLPVDRAFTIKGFGTVVTGSLLSGHLDVEESASLLPGLEGPLRIRGVQVHGQAVARVTAGQRAAINLVGVEPDAISRGMVLCRAGELPTGRMLDVELTLLPAVEDAMPRRSKLLLHLGTMQVEATVALVDLDQLRPGETGLAQLRLQTPVAVLPDQRFILRGSRVIPGRGTTVAGGRVLALSGAKRRRGAALLLRPLVEGDAQARLQWLLRQAGYAGMTQEALFAQAGMAPKALTRALELASARGMVLLVDKERRAFLSGEVFRALCARAVASIQAFHDREPNKELLPKEELRQRLATGLDPRLFHRVLTALAEGGTVETAGEGVRIKGRGRTVSHNDAQTRTQVVAALDASGLAPPRPDELATKLKVPVQRISEVLRHAAADGLVLKVSEDMYFAPSAVESLRVKLVEHLKAHKEITTQGFKDLVGQSRKFVIPLSEYFDREKVTLRVGEKRVLRKG